MKHALRDRHGRNDKTTGEEGEIKQASAPYHAPFWQQFSVVFHESPGIVAALCSSVWF